MMGYDYNEAHGDKKEFRQERFWLEEANERRPETCRSEIGFDHQEHVSHADDPRDEGMLYFLRR
jgi:hypothetical protein